MNTELKEGVIGPEREGEAPLDAILAHTYLMSETEDGRFSQSLRGKLVARAAARLFDGGRGANQIVVAGGKIWGEEGPSLAELMTRDLVNRYHIPREKIVSTPEDIGQEARETTVEIEIFLQLAKERGWTRLAEVAEPKHIWSLRQLHKKMPGWQEIILKTSDELLRSDNQKIKKLLSRFRWSRYELMHALYEGTKTTLLLLGYSPKRLVSKAEHSRRSKMPHLPPPLPQVDVYKL